MTHNNGHQIQDPRSKIRDTRYETQTARHETPEKQEPPQGAVAATIPSGKAVYWTDCTLVRDCLPQSWVNGLGPPRSCASSERSVCVPASHGRRSSHGQPIVIQVCTMSPALASLPCHWNMSTSSICRPPRRAHSLFYIRRPDSSGDRRAYLVTAHSRPVRRLRASLDSQVPGRVP